MIILSARIAFRHSLGALNMRGEGISLSSPLNRSFYTVKTGRGTGNRKKSSEPGAQKQIKHSETVSHPNMPKSKKQRRNKDDRWIWGDGQKQNGGKAAMIITSGELIIPRGNCVSPI